MGSVVVLDPTFWPRFYQANPPIQIEGKAKLSSCVNNINIGELESLIISIRPLDEQKAIVNALDVRADPGSLDS